MSRSAMHSLVAIALAFAVAVGVVPPARAAPGAKTEPLAFYVNYAARVPTAPLVAHALSIVHPDATVDLAAAHRAGNTVLAYLSVGEVAADAPYRAEVLARRLDALASGVDIGHAQGNVAVGGAHLVLLNAPVVGELYLSLLGVAGIAQKSQGVLVLWVLGFTQQRHAEDLGVKINGALEVADAEHGVEDSHGCNSSMLLSGEASACDGYGGI